MTTFCFVVDGGYTLIAGGDFNIDMSINNHCSRDFDTVLASNGFANVLDVPNGVTAESQSTLHLFITNISHPKIRTGALSCPISDHLPVFFSMDSAAQKLKQPKVIRYQRITDDALGAFWNALKRVDFNHILYLTNANETYNKFIDIFKQVYDSHFSFTTCKSSRKTLKPWITPEFRIHIHICKHWPIYLYL